MNRLILGLVFLVACESPELGRRSLPVSDPVLHIAPQNTFYSGELACGAAAGVNSISGHWFLQVGVWGSGFPEFLARSQAQVEARIDQYLAVHPEVDPMTLQAIILDIENPHPNHLWTYSAADQDAIVAAYKTRIAAARAKFPNATLGLYGTLVPDQRGVDNEKFQERLSALQEAAAEGLFDQLDILVPVLYARFGCDQDGACDNGFETYQAYTQQGVDGSRALVDLPVVPLLNFEIANGNSAFNDAQLLDLDLPDPLAATLDIQLAVLAAEEIQDVAFWIGQDSHVLRQPNPNGRTVTDYVCQL